jgi:ferrous iron transport protein A
MVQWPKLNKGEKLRVVAFKAGTSSCRRQLLSHGLVPGAVFKFIRVSPLGDPLQIQLGCTNLILRKDEIAQLLLERI